MLQLITICLKYKHNVLHDWSYSIGICCTSWIWYNEWKQFEDCELDNAETINIPKTIDIELSEKY